MVDARDRIVERGIVINGLPIVIPDAPSTMLSKDNLANLDVYYEDCVIGGPGAFVVTVDDIARFAAAIRRKLILEIAGRPLSVVPAALAGRRPRIDCLVGEKTYP